MRLALAQIDPVVGDLAGNRELILARLEEAKRDRADLVVFPELAVTGYPPEDLLLRRGFVRAAERSLAEIATATEGVTAIVGTPLLEGEELYNAAAVCVDGAVAAYAKKRHLPNYGVFDEKRYFASGTETRLFTVAGTRIGVTVCEDMWLPGPPTTELAQAGAELVVNLSASPFHLLRDREREEIFRFRARENGVRIALCNTVGGQDELVFDGHSFVLDAAGEVVARAPGFVEHLLLVDLDDPTSATIAPLCDELEQMREALVLGLRDYVRKNGFSEIVVGVSGGIDSALTAAIAVEALGAEKVHCVSMPSRYSSPGTRDDARRLAENLGCDFRELAIEPVVEAFEHVLRDLFADREPDLAEENLQARIRGTLLMALSNKFGWLLVATGNKSEMSVGYATLYGDMAGGFALLKDVFKTDVFRLSRHLNERAGRELVPQSTIDRAPSAELRADQLDEDSLPPYAELDRVLEAYVEEDRTLEELSADGFDPDVVARAVALVDRAEYKRRQAPPGVRLRPKAFGRDRRTPITNRWRS
ncbi:MAG TPA: NAD+ synthase [Gaiellaceae bacterium]|nr:NAD+ synthase [Gaiellaceae bacterium]